MQAVQKLFNKAEWLLEPNAQLDDCNSSTTLKDFSTDGEDDCKSTLLNDFGLEEIKQPLLKRDFNSGDANKQPLLKSDFGLDAKKRSQEKRDSYTMSLKSIEIEVKKSKRY